MNTKATAAETAKPAAAPIANKPAVTPTAKAANGAAGKQDDDLVFTPITEEEDNEYNSLLKRHLDLNEAEDDRFHALAKKIREAKNKRNTFIGGIKTKLTSAAASIKDIFSKEEIKAAYKITELFDQAEINAAAKAKKRGSNNLEEGGAPKVAKAKKALASENNPDFIRFTKNPTDNKLIKEIVIKQGRANEFHSGKSIFGPLGVSMARTKGATVEETLSNIQNFVVDKAYAKTADGKAELDKIAEAIFTYVPAKKAA